MFFGILSVAFAVLGGICGFLQERADHKETITKASEEVLKNIKK